MISIEFNPKDYPILIVDDEKDIVSLLREELEEYGFEVDTALGGEEAWKLVNRKAYQIVLTDVKMPTGNGIKLLEDIKSKYGRIPFVYVMSGYCDSSEMDILAKGGIKLFGKPVDVDEFVENFSGLLKQVA